MTSSIFTKEYDKFRKLLSKYRQECGVTQAKLAEKLNRPQSYISKYESGERRLDVIEFLKIAKILKTEKSQVGISVTSGDGLTDFGCGDGLMCFCVLTTVELPA